MSRDIGLSPRELQSRALRGVSWSTLSSILALPMAIVVSVVLARSLGPHEFARFAYLSFLVPLLVQLADVGYAQATTRWASQAFAAGDLSRTGELAGKVAGWNLLRLPFICAVVLAVSRPGPLPASLVVGFALVASATAGLVIALSAENRVATAAKLSFLQAVAAATSGTATALAGGSGTTVWAVSFASGVVAAPGWLITANPSLRRAALTPRLPRALPPGFWRFGLTAVAASGGYIFVFSRSEVVILEALGEHQALAVFALAYGLSQRLTTPVDTLLGPLIPALTALEAAHRDRLRAGFERALRLSSSAVAFLGATALVGTALAAPLLFGPEYEGVGAAFVALAVISLLRAAAQPYTALTYAVGRPGITLRALTVALVADLAAALALIPPFGIWGAIVANAVGGITALILTARPAAGAHSLSRAGVPAARLILLAVVSCALAYAAGLLGGQLHPAVGALVSFAAGALGFLLLAKAAGGLLPRRDADVVLEGLPRALARASRAAALLVRTTL